MSNQVHVFELQEGELIEVFSCRCGIQHNKNDEALYRQHNCFHDGTLAFVQDKDPDYFGAYSGAKLTCPDCGKVFSFQDVWQQCGVCGYRDRRPTRDRTCPSCGTAPDFSGDANKARMAWIATGPVWWSDTIQEPQDWRPMQQLDYLWEMYSRGISLNGEPIAHRCIIATNMSGLCRKCGNPIEIGDEVHSKDGLYCPSCCPQHSL